MTQEMSFIKEVDNLPNNKEYYLELNKKLREVGLPELIVTDNAVYKDELHKMLGIGIKLEG